MELMVTILTCDKQYQMVLYNPGKFWSYVSCFLNIIDLQVSCNCHNSIIVIQR